MRDVPGFENIYKISLAGPEIICYSFYNKNWGYGAPHPLSNKVSQKNGRIFWCLHKNNKTKCKQAAYWIAITYPELVQNEYFPGAEICHEDNNPLNNHPSNLKWGTHKYNMNNLGTRKKRSETMKGRKINEETREKFKTRKTKPTKTIYQYNLQGELLNIWVKASEAANALKISEGPIRKCCLGDIHTYKGYIWSYTKKGEPQSPPLFTVQV